MLYLEFYGKTYNVGFTINHYVNNKNLYVGLVTVEDGMLEPWSDLTVNLGVKCAENCAFIDTNNNGPQIIDWLTKNGLGYPTDVFRPSGMCVYPEFCFSMDELQKHLVD